MDRTFKTKKQLISFNYLSLLCTSTPPPFLKASSCLLNVFFFLLITNRRFLTEEFKRDVSSVVFYKIIFCGLHVIFIPSILKS
jgi:hypothetical protein